MSTATQDLIPETMSTFPAVAGDRKTSEESVVDLMQDAYAPISLFAVGRADWAEEIAFRALFLVATFVAAYGVMTAW